MALGDVSGPAFMVDTHALTPPTGTEVEDGNSQEVSRKLVMPAILPSAMSSTCSAHASCSLSSAEGVLPERRSAIGRLGHQMRAAVTLGGV